MSEKIFHRRRTKGFPWVKERMAFILECLLLWYFSRTASYRRPRRPTGRILIARTDGLGDFILWLGCAKELRLRFPDKKIVLLLDSTKPTADLAKHTGYFDEVMKIDIHNYTRFASIFKMLHRSFDLVIQPVYSRMGFTDILLFACRAGKRVTLDTNGKYLTEGMLRQSNRGYDRIIPTDPSQRHELIRNGELMRGMGFPEFRSGLPWMPVMGEIPIKEMAYFIVFPSASCGEKIWSALSFAQICDFVIEQTGYVCVAAGGMEDQQEICEMTAAMKYGAGVMEKAGVFSICEMAEAIRHARLAIGNDTGPMHIAAICRIPSVVIVGDQEYGRFFPYETENSGDFVPLAVAAGTECRGCQAWMNRPCPYPLGEKGTLWCISQVTVADCKLAVRVAIGLSKCNAQLPESIFQTCPRR